jgi:periplasmic mercuric ion binding protein
MKNSIKFLMLIVVLGFFQKLNAQEIEQKLDTVQIKTSAICGDCKERIEHNVSYEKGVTYVNLDDKTKVLTVVYKTGKTDKEKIKMVISKTGYDADDLAADPKAYERLPDCCKKDNAPH